MNTFLEMSLYARLYITGIVISGVLATAAAFSQWDGSQPRRFWAYLLVAILVSAFKIRLPAITGTLSLSSLLVLVGIVQLQAGETMLIGLAGVLTQCFWKPKSPVLPVRVAFSAAANAIAIAASYFVSYVGAPGPSSAHSLDAVRVLAAACCYFLVNTALVALVVSLTERKQLKDVWTACYLWSFPYYLGGACFAWLSTLLSRYFGWQSSLALLPISYLIYRSYRVYMHRLENDQHHTEEMAGLHLRTIEALALAIEAKDHTTHDHLRRVRVYALELGTRMGLGELDLQSLRAAALLHDIGKLAVPEHIISKPGKLTPEEFERMKIHPGVGAQILEQVQFPYPVAPIVLCHHEKWDGTGYPNGLKGEEIPLGARILSAVDALDALASDRQYRRALPLDQAMEIVAAESGRTFDPAVIQMLQSCYVELEHHAVQQPRSSVRLDTDPVTLKGGAPATGFEQSFGFASETEPAPAAAGEKIEALTAVAQARQAVEELHAWARLSDGSLSLTETLAPFAVRLRDIVSHDSIAFYLKRGNHLLPAFVGGQNRPLFSCLRIPYGEGLSGWVAENRKPILNGNPSVEAGYLNDPKKFSTLRSALAVPLETANGVIGVLAFYRMERDAFSAADLSILGAVGPRIAQSLEHAANLKSPALELGALTQLSNVGQLFLHLAEMLRVQQPNLTLLLCDLDNFPEIVRRFGNRSAQRFLNDIAASLSHLFHTGVFLAYLGTGEFAFLFSEAATDELEQHRDRIRFLVNVAARQLPDLSLASLNFGTAVAGADGCSPEALLIVAESSLQRARFVNPVSQGAAVPPLVLQAVAPATP